MWKWDIINKMEITKDGIFGHGKKEKKDGKQVDFVGQDQQGKFAVVETTKEAGQLLFIVRKGDWKEKATRWGGRFK